MSLVSAGVLVVLYPLYTTNKLGGNMSILHVRQLRFNCRIVRVSKK